MTQSVVVFTQSNNSIVAGQELGQKIQHKFGLVVPDVVIVFASSVYDYSSFLNALKETCNPKILVGSSSAGEFTSNDFGTDSACAIAIQSSDLKFKAGVAQGIKEDRVRVAEQLSEALADAHDYQYYSAMIFADALSGYTDELVDLLTEKTMGKYQ
ncbi:MAG: hypothetical protein JWQ25_1067, partial [Daejeonella sp.]|nr:hypothetical protein [Daejeonella sp.]